MGRSKPTISDVAARADVSRATVSRVMNNEPGASPEVRERVRRAMADLGYEPDQTARALASGRQRAVDVVAITNGPVIGWLGSHPYYSRVLAGVISALEGTDVQVRVQALSRPDDFEAVDAIAARATVGVVLADVPLAAALRFQRRCRRVVSLSATSTSMPTIEADNAGGAYAAVEYLHRSGRRRIAAVHGPEHSADARERRDGYLRAIRAFGLHGFGESGEFRREDGHQAAHRLLAAHPGIDAMFVACDLMAAGAAQAVTALGRKVPDDVSLVGFDDSVAAVCANPPLTTMRMPVEEMAVAATRLLLDGNIASGYRRCLPVELVVRGSTTRGAD
ncbi:LacI family DNA-binding transcriptional regulator [Umezawaea sp. Da 62-37]|uniref:LacI family DNA-binding transcriptional regulator n=1 Tax=Umezawaea sp. Da 62-37 TaxID=3075927 RepID=UPI0028F6CC76|nr:LacI family DNA-binding transcriptional regulator [Umezawaea sp. Da 62-37]WNV85505.1 LacI family DNA-binding transcriptional regulator [Umezawaea sp. Da 62-37]